MADLNSGYHGWSMSKRAFAAYEAGEKPLSKWTKKAMVEAISNYCNDNDLFFDKTITHLKKDAIFERFFQYSSWHHTSKFCNETNFYQLDESAVCEYFRPLTNQELKEREIARNIERHKEEVWREQNKKEEKQYEARLEAFQEQYGCHPCSFAAYIKFFPNNIEYFISKKGNECVRIHDEEKHFHGASCPIKRINEQYFISLYDKTSIILLLNHIEQRKSTPSLSDRCKDAQKASQELNNFGGLVEQHDIETR